MNYRWEKMVRPPTVSIGVVPVPPQVLEVPYDPTATEALFNQIGETHDVEVMYCTPFFLFSPNRQSYIVHGKVRFKGYLSKFSPGGEPTLDATIQPCGEVEDARG